MVHPDAMQGVTRMTDMQRQQYGLSTWPQGPPPGAGASCVVPEHVDCSVGSQPLEPPVSVDDVLRAPGWLDAQGRIRVAAVAIEHRGAALFPLDVEHNPECATAAALVPLSMMHEEGD